MSGDGTVPVDGARQAAALGDGFGFGGDLDYGNTWEPLNELSWRDLDSLGQFIANNTAVSIDGTMTSPEFDSNMGGGGVDGGAGEFWYDNFWQGNDVIF